MEEQKSFYATFSPDSSMFCIGDEDSFKIFSSVGDSVILKKKIRIDGGIKLIDILTRCNILAFVGTGEDPKFANSKVILYDFVQKKAIKELIVSYEIKNIKLKRDYIFVVGDEKIMSFTFGNYEKKDTITTYNNERGILGISTDPKINKIAYPSAQGEVTIKNYEEKDKDGNYKIIKIQAHTSNIFSLGMNSDGSFLATASEKGNNIRIYRTKDGDFIQELRRGSTTAEIYSLSFSMDSTYLACSSNKGTIHIFQVKKGVEEVNNQKSVIGNICSFFGVKSEFFGSEWSFAQFRINNNNRSIVTFAPNNAPSVLVITSDGKYYEGKFDVNSGGECQTSLTLDIMNLQEEVEN